MTRNPPHQRCPSSSSARRSLHLFNLERRAVFRNVQRLRMEGAALRRCAAKDDAVKV